jgi:type IV secretion system protein VirD4
MNAAIFAAAALGAVMLAIHLLDRRIERGRSGAGGRPQGAHWASGRDLRELRVRASQPGRLILGRHGRRLLAAERRASVIVVAPVQSGKTTGLAIPALLEWDGPAIATSVKSDLLRDTLPARRERGRAMVFDPTAVTGMNSVHATPLSGCGSWRGAMRVAHWLAGSARSASGGLEDSEFWYAAAEKLLSPLLFAAASSGGEMADVVRWLNQGPQGEEEVTRALREAGDEDALSAWQATWNREERQRSSIYTTAETITAAFADPRVLDATSHADYTPADLLDGASNTLYLCAPAHEQQRLRTLFAMMIQELVAVVYESSAQTGEPIDPPLLIVLDEAANIAPIPNLDEIASTGAGQGIQLLSVFQDLAQLHTRYGERAQTIVNNHRAKVFGTGISDPETLSYVSRVVGAGEFSQHSKTAGERGRHSTTEGTTYRDLTPANVVREAEPGSALLLYGHLPPARLRLRPWFEDEGLQALAAAQPERQVA